jgi:hypothetical protein
MPQIVTDIICYGFVAVLLSGILYIVTMAIRDLKKQVDIRNKLQGK